jgi:hypothetical protein
VTPSQSDANMTAWRASLVGGVVVAAAVWGLLEALRRSVLDVDKAVDDVWIAGKRLAQNTQTTHLLAGTHERGAGLLAELEHHRDPKESKA